MIKYIREFVLRHPEYKCCLVGKTAGRYHTRRNSLVRLCKGININIWNRDKNTQEIVESFINVLPGKVTHFSSEDSYVVVLDDQKNRPSFHLYINKRSIGINKVVMDNSVCILNLTETMLFYRDEIQKMLNIYNHLLQDNTNNIHLIRQTEREHIRAIKKLSKLAAVHG